MNLGIALLTLATAGCTLADEPGGTASREADGPQPTLDQIETVDPLPSSTTVGDSPIADSTPHESSTTSEAPTTSTKGQPNDGAEETIDAAPLATDEPLVATTVAATPTPLPDVVGAVPNDATADLQDLGFAVIVLETCAEPATDGQVIEVAKPDETILVDGDGVTPAGEAVPSGISLEVLVGNSDLCDG